MAQHIAWVLDEYIEEYELEPDYVAEGLALEFIENVLEIMRAKGMSQSHLAEAVGVSRSHISRIFNAPPNLALRTIARIAIALGATPYLVLKSEGANANIRRLGHTSIGNEKLDVHPKKS